MCSDIGIANGESFFWSGFIEGVAQWKRLAWELRVFARPFCASDQQRAERCVQPQITSHGAAVSCAPYGNSAIGTPNAAIAIVAEPAHHHNLVLRSANATKSGTLTNNASAA